MSKDQIVLILIGIAIGILLIVSGAQWIDSINTAMEAR